MERCLYHVVKNLDEFDAMRIRLGMDRQTEISYQYHESIKINAQIDRITLSELEIIASNEINACSILQQIASY